MKKITTQGLQIYTFHQNENDYISLTDGSLQESFGAKGCGKKLDEKLFYHRVFGCLGAYK